jgi:chromosomal replication initiator protein
MENNISINQIVSICALFFQVTISEIKSPSKKGPIAKARQIAMYLAKKNTGASLKVIGEEIGGKDHTTVMHSIRVVENSIDCCDNYAYPYIESLESQIKISALFSDTIEPITIN